MPASYKLSLICGLTPLTFGLVIFISWLITRTHWLMLAGYYTLLAGIAFFILGLLSLTIYGHQEKNRTGRYPKKRLVISLGILLSNLPTAVFIVLTAFHILSTTRITISNQSSSTLYDFTLIAGDTTHFFPPIAPNQDSTKRLYFKHEGTVNYRFTMNNSVTQGILLGYVTHGMGGTVDVVINNNGAVGINVQH